MKKDNKLRLYAHTIAHYDPKVKRAIIWAYSNEQILAWHAKQKEPSQPYEYDITGYMPDSPLKGYDPTDPYSAWGSDLFNPEDVTPEFFSKYKNFSKTIFINQIGDVYVNGKWHDRVVLKERK